MRNWAAYPPNTQDEKNQQKKDVLKFLLETTKGRLYNECLPEPKHFCTPSLHRRQGSGMKAFEWDILIAHAEANKVKIAGFWPDTWVIHPAILKTRLKTTAPEKLLYPWIPRLDGILLTHTNQLIPVEIVNTLSCAAIGELFIKTMYWEAGHPDSLPIHHSQLIYTTDNAVVRAMFKNAIPSQMRSMIRLIYHDLKASRIGGKGESDTPAGPDSPGNTDVAP